jgi:RNA polymerase sigma-70 factor (ECF subfamily)
MVTFMQRTTKREVPGKKIADLIAQAKEDPSMFGPLYQRFIQPIYRYLYSRVKNRQVAEDLAAQTFLSALQALPRYRHQNFSAWLFSIARNKAMDHFRKSKREIDGEFPDNLVAHSDVPKQVSQTLEIQQLSGLIQGLRPYDQELIRLRYVADLTFAEMGVVLGKKEDAVKKALYRLLDQLENQMEVGHE